MVKKPYPKSVRDDTTLHEEFGAGGGIPASRPLREDTALHEECGVVGAFSFSGQDVSIPIFNAMMALQHRGQDSAGMATFNGSKIQNHRKLGLVASVFGEESMQRLKGFAGIGHVRYPTIGAGGEEDAQPFLVNFPRKGLALAHNGNIANYGIMRSGIEGKGHQLSSTCDIELALAMLASSLQKTEDIFKAIGALMQELDGSYSICGISGQGELIAFRDPKALRPLCFGRKGDLIMFASESVALDINGIPLSGDVKPGEAIIVTKDGIKSKIAAKSPSESHCMFEYVYFSRPDSVIDGKLVYSVRHELGRRLARASPADADIIVAVPDTSRPAAEGYANVAKLPLVEGLIKNRYIGRTFIMPSQEKRMQAVRFKLNAVRPLVEGKRIVLIDDSIVRGTTSGPIVSLLREAGAKEVHLRITCPPVIGPCFYGVDLPSYSELIASSNTVEQIRKKVGGDSLAYLSIEDLVEAIGMERNRLCLGCITDSYPTETGRRLARVMKEEKRPKAQGRQGVRVWEEKII